MNQIVLIASGLLIASTAGAFAHETKASIEAREQRQLGQIEQGRQDGSITWREGIELRKQQKAIAATEAEYFADGRLSKHEKHELKELQEEAAEHIKEEQTDGWRRPSWLPRFGR